MLNWPVSIPSLCSSWVLGSRLMQGWYFGRLGRIMTVPLPENQPVSMHCPYFACQQPLRSQGFRPPGFQVRCPLWPWAALCPSVSPPVQQKWCSRPLWSPLRHAVEKRCLSALTMTMDYLLLPQEAVPQPDTSLLKSYSWYSVWFLSFPNSVPLLIVISPLLFPFPRGKRRVAFLRSDILWVAFVPDKPFLNTTAEHLQWLWKYSETHSVKATLATKVINWRD